MASTSAKVRTVALHRDPSSSVRTRSRFDASSGLCPSAIMKRAVALPISLRINESPPINTLQSSHHRWLISLIGFTNDLDATFRVPEEEPRSVLRASVGNICSGQETVSDTRIQVTFRQPRLHRIKIPLGSLILSGFLCSPNRKRIIMNCRRQRGACAVMHEHRRLSSEYIVRVALDPALPAFSQVGGVLAVRRGPWLCADVGGCCRHYCRRRSKPVWLREVLGEVVHGLVGRVEVLRPQPPTVSHDGGCAGRATRHVCLAQPPLASATLSVPSWPEPATGPGVRNGGPARQGFAALPTGSRSAGRARRVAGGRRRRGGRQERAAVTGRRRAAARVSGALLIK